VYTVRMRDKMWTCEYRVARKSKPLQIHQYITLVAYPEEG